MKKIKYKKCHVIELNLKRLILARFVTKYNFFHVRIKKTDVEYLQKWKK